MPHFTQVPPDQQDQAHGFIWCKLRRPKDADNAMTAIQALRPPPEVRVATISHFEADRTPPGNVRRPGDRIAVFLNLSRDDGEPIPVGSDAAHAAVESFASAIADLPPGGGPKYFNPPVEHY